MSGRHSHADPSSSLIAAFVQGLRAEPRQALLNLRALAISLGPDVVERVAGGGVTYLRRETPFLVVEGVRARLLVAFPPGIELADPMGRLLRRGEERYFRLDGPSDLDAHVQEFVRKAYSVAR